MKNNLRIHYKGYSKAREEDIYYILDIENDIVYTQSEKTLKDLGICKNDNFQVIKDNPAQLFWL